MSGFFHLVKPLQQILERNCELMFNLHMSKDDIGNTDLQELDWIYGWLYNKLNPKKD